MRYGGYWQREITQQTLLLTKNKTIQVNKELGKQYKGVLQDLTKRLNKLYLEIVNDDGSLNVNEFYKYNRYYELRKALLAQLKDLGQEQIDTMDRHIAQTYKLTSPLVSDGFIYLKNQGIDLNTIVNVYDLTKHTPNVWNKDVWFSDGLSGAQRVYKNLTYLQNTVEKGLIDCVVRGASKDELIKTLTARFDVSFYQAQRLARTELSHTQNQAKVNTYKKYGVTQYEYIANDSNDECGALDGQVFYLDEAVEGENYPPLHPNCECTTAPYIG